MFNRITDKSNVLPNLPRESSLVNYSEFSELKTDVTFRSFSVKYVVDGCENYKISNQKFALKKGDCLLANHHGGGSIEIGGRNIVKGLCIDIAPSIIDEVYMSNVRPEIVQSDSKSFFTSNLYPENKYNIENCNFIHSISEIANKIHNSQKQFEFTNEFYYYLAEKIVFEQAVFHKQLTNIKATKAETKKDIFRKLYTAKNFIEFEFRNIDSINTIASYVGMSEYHFYRLFKNFFHESPYSYLNMKRIENAKLLLKDKDLSLTELAYLCGFNDLPTFSKVFKKYTGKAPSKYF